VQKPNPLKDGDGKPRVSVDLSDSSFSVLPALPKIVILKDSRAAECDIVKVTKGNARLLFPRNRLKILMGRC